MTKKQLTTSTVLQKASSERINPTGKITIVTFLHYSGHYNKVARPKPLQNKINVIFESIPSTPSCGKAFSENRYHSASETLSAAKHFAALVRVTSVNASPLHNAILQWTRARLCVFMK